MTAAQESLRTSDEIAVLRETIAALIVAKDAAGLAQLYEPDACLFPPSGEEIRGRETIAAALAGLFEMGLCGQRIEVEDLWASGDLAVETSRAFLDFLSPDGTVETSKSMCLISYRREPSGSWLVSRDMWTSPPTDA